MTKESSSENRQQQDIGSTSRASTTYDEAIPSSGESTTPGENVPSPNDTPPQKKKSHKKLGIALGIIAVVIVAAGAGFWVWHEQPSFCNAVCHSPMDSYVEGYYSEDPSLGITEHANAEVSCVECHDPGISEQINEAMAWLSNDYSDPLSIRRFGTVDFCNQCHDDGDTSTGKDWTEVVEATANYQGSGRNPHDSHLGAIDCYTCHSMHNTSKLYCTQCHDNIKNPESW